MKRCCGERTERFTALNGESDTWFDSYLLCPAEDLPDQIHVNPFVLTPVDKEAVRGL